MQDDVEGQVQAMRSTLEEIYSSQLDLARSELEQSHHSSMIDLRETLDKERKDEVNKLEQGHKEEVGKLEQEWNVKFEQLKQDYEEQLRDQRLGDSLGKCSNVTKTLCLWFQYCVHEFIFCQEIL